MKRVAVAAMLLVLPVVALAAQPPQWAFHTVPRGFVSKLDGSDVRQLPGSTKSFTYKQIEDEFSPKDWFPNEHPPMPAIVAFGRKPDVPACAQCHLASGMGHPEGAALAGLPSTYIVEQLQAFRNGSRSNSARMANIAVPMTAGEERTAARYFSALRPRRFITVSEATMVPKSFVGDGNQLLRSPGDATEPLGRRIVELASEPERASDRSPHAVYHAFVPPGSIARGRTFVASGGNGMVLRCAACHGAKLTGYANYPGIAGHSPTSTFRQLYSFKHGMRVGPGPALMHGVVTHLTDDDMIAIAAYLGTLPP